MTFNGVPDFVRLEINGHPVDRPVKVKLPSDAKRIAYLRERYPVIAANLPLVTDADRWIADAIYPDTGLSAEIIAQLLREHTASTAYLSALATPDSMRHDPSSGEPVEPVTGTDRRKAQMALDDFGGKRVFSDAITSKAGAMAWLKCEYPSLFDAGAVLPVRIGVYDEIKRRADVVGVCCNAIRRVFQEYTRSDSYLKALAAEGAQRHDLDGAACGAVTEGHRQIARLMLDGSLKLRNSQDEMQNW